MCSAWRKQQWQQLFCKSCRDAEDGGRQAFGNKWKPVLLLLQYILAMGTVKLSMKWQTAKWFQRGEAGSTRCWASERAVLSFSEVGCHGQGEDKAQGGSAVLPIPQGFGLSLPLLAMSCSGHMTQSVLNGWLRNWAPTCRESWEVPPVHSSSHQWFQHFGYSACPLMQWSCSSFALV